MLSLGGGGGDVSNTGVWLSTWVVSLRSFEPGQVRCPPFNGRGCLLVCLSTIPETGQKLSPTNDLRHGAGENSS